MCVEVFDRLAGPDLFEGVQVPNFERFRVRRTDPILTEGNFFDWIGSV